MKIFPHLLSILLILGCSESPKSLSAQEKDQLKAEVKAQAMKVMDALKRNDEAGFRGLVSLDDDFMFILGNEFYNGSAFSKLLGEVAPLIDRQEFETKQETYNVLDGDLVAYSWHGENLMYMKDGSIVTYKDYFATWLFKRFGNDWKMIYGHESVFIPDTEPFPN